MKNIFKKNQIIITALAIMIVIAGYLSFTNKDKPDDADAIQTANPGLEDYDILTETEGTDLEADVTDGTDTTATDDASEETDATADSATDDADAVATEDITDETTAEEDNDETVPVETADAETGDISDEDILANSQDVTDTGELNLEEETVPGEAVLASTTIDAGYFSSAKINREQMRSKNKEAYRLIIDSPDATEALKKDAIASMLQLTDIAEKENSIEIVLGAKGFDEAVVSIDEEDVEVIVNASTITEQQAAIIEELVKRKANVTVEHIQITPVIIGE